MAPPMVSADAAVILQMHLILNWHKRCLSMAQAVLSAGEALRRCAGETQAG